MTPLRPQRHGPAASDARPTGFWRSRYAIGLIVFGAIALYFLLSEHRAHLFFALPFLLLLACPLMHVFMHHGHGGHAGKNVHRDGSDAGSDPPPAPRAATKGEPR